jgi:diguanylate cyclase (GGDEF)-like protein
VRAGSDEVCRARGTRAGRAEERELSELAAGVTRSSLMRPCLAGCLRELVRAAVRTGYVPMSPVEVEELLHGLVGRVVDALFAEPFRTTPGYEFGLALVEADFVGPEMLGSTVQVLGSRLLADLGADTADRRKRLADLLGGMSTGYARALRDRVRDDQESTARAMVIAQHLAERAVRESEERRWWEARHDPLTGLANRALFTEQLAAIFTDPAKGPELGVCLLGLDRFGAINDSLGHDAADGLLVAVARRLEERFGPAGHLLARMGSAEFAILATDPADAGDIDEIADAAIATLSTPFAIGQHSLPVVASAGVVHRLVAETNPAEVVRWAEITLRWARADGGGRWLRFDPERHADDVARWALTAALPEALRRGEFTVEYQPILGLADHEVHGMEALVRWRHPERGLLGPDHFIELAEETGLIVPLGRWVLEQACREARRWAGTGPPFVSVNLAVHQARDPGLVDDVVRLLAETGLEPWRLQLELTESTFVGADGAPMAAMRALAGIGVRIAIDDFGTGWANYAHLRTLPICEVKLAAAFLDGLRSSDAPDPVDQQVVAGLVSLAHTLGLTVTAEGVETAAQAERLRRLDCDAGQGWHFGRPGPPEWFTPLLVRS